MPDDGQILGVPEVVDVDRDGTADLVVTVVFRETAEERQRRSRDKAGNAPAAEMLSLGRRIVTAISGRSGRWLWTYPIDGQFTGLILTGRDRPATLARGPRADTVLVVADTQCIPLDAATGRPRGRPIDLGFEPVRPVQNADLDGDGESDVLALGPGCSRHANPGRIFVRHRPADLDRTGPGLVQAGGQTRRCRRIGPCSPTSTATVEAKSWFQTPDPCQPGVTLRASGLSTAQPAAVDGRGF